MEFINYYTYLSGSYSDSDHTDIRESLQDREFIDDSDIENNPSDYYDLNNVSRFISDVKYEAFLESDLAAF